MTRNTDATADGESGDDCGLERFERNRYFHGKLMTARDMAADQRYHRERHRTHARHLGGTGVVCGLDVTVTDDDEGGVAVTVEPGYAVDGAGNPIVVENETTETFTDGGVDASDPVAVWVAYAECDRETVPVPGAEDACEDECAYNRTLEIFDVRCRNYDSADAGPKGVADVSFPTKADLADGLDSGAASPTDPGLATIARSYTDDGDGGEVACGDNGGSEAVFLGVYVPDEGDAWTRAPEKGPRERAYTNDMLYAATARHTADFANPHQSSLATEDTEAGANIHVEDDHSEDADVAVTSSDGVVTIDVEGQEIDLSAGPALTKLIETRIAPMEQYVMDKSLKYTYRIFSGVASNYESETAGAIAETTKEAIDERAYASKSDYVDVIESCQGHQETIAEELGDAVTEETLTRYEDALDRLGTVLEDVENRGVLAIAVAQDEVCEAADWFERPEMPEIELPGTTLPGGSLLPTDPIRPINPTLPGAGSGGSGSGSGSGGSDGDGESGGSGAGLDPIRPTPIDPTMPISPTFPNGPVGGGSGGGGGRAGGSGGDGSGDGSGASGGSDDGSGTDSGSSDGSSGSGGSSGESGGSSGSGGASSPTIPITPTFPTGPTVGTGGSGGAGSGVSGGSSDSDDSTDAAASGSDGAGGSGSGSVGDAVGTGGTAPLDPGTPMRVPDLTGQQKETVEDSLSTVGVTTTVEAKQVEDTRSIEGTGVNEVAEQDPMPGETVSAGDEVTVSVTSPPGVTRISGIGDKTASKLADAGIETVGELARADPQTVADATGAADSRVSDWQSTARNYATAYPLTKVEGVGTEEAEALADAANVTSPEDLQTADASVVESTAEAAREAGSADETAVETVKSMDLNGIKERLNSLGL